MTKIILSIIIQCVVVLRSSILLFSHFNLYICAQQAQPDLDSVALYFLITFSTRPYYYWLLVATRIPDLCHIYIYINNSMEHVSHMQICTYKMQREPKYVNIQHHSPHVQTKWFNQPRSQSRLFCIKVFGLVYSLVNGVVFRLLWVSRSYAV